MHKSTDPNNFRNKRYLENMNQEFKTMFRAYHKYIAYRNKLLHELTMSEEDIERMQQIDKKMINNIQRANNRVEKSDFDIENKGDDDE